MGVVRPARGGTRTSCRELDSIPSCLKGRRTRGPWGTRARIVREPLAAVERGGVSGSAGASGGFLKANRPSVQLSGERVRVTTGQLLKLNRVRQGRVRQGGVRPTRARDARGCTPTTPPRNAEVLLVRIERLMSGIFKWRVAQIARATSRECHFSRAPQLRARPPRRAAKWHAPRVERSTSSRLSARREPASGDIGAQRARGRGNEGARLARARAR